MMKKQRMRIPAFYFCGKKEYASFHEHKRVKQ